MATSVPALPPTRDRRQRVQAAATGIAVLKGLAALGGRASLTTLARHLAESPAKVHRYLGSMVDEGLVAQDAVSQQYYLGPEAIQIGLVAMRVADPLRLAEAPLARLCEQLGLTSFLAVMGNRGPTIVRFEEPGLPVTVNVRVGSVLSVLQSATGQVFLTWHADAPLRAQAQAEFARLPESRRVEGFDRHLASLQVRVQRQGVAVVRDGYLQGISAVAAPIFNATGRVAAVLTVLGASGGFDAAAGGKVARFLKDEAEGIRRSIGGQLPAQDWVDPIGTQATGGQMTAAS